MTTDVTTQSIAAKLKLKIIPLTLVVGGFALAGVGAFLFFKFPFASSQKQQVVKPQLTVAQLHQQFLTVVNDYTQTPANSRSTKEILLKQRAQERQVRMTKLLTTNTEEFLQLALPGGTWNQLPPDVQALVEKETEVEGTLVLEHQDNFTTSTSTEQYFLLDSSQPTATRTPVYFATSPSGNELNAKTTLSGWILSGNLASSYSAMSTATATDTPPSPIIGQKKVAVIPVTFVGRTLQVPTVSNLRQTIFLDPTSVNAYYQENSDQGVPSNKLSLTGKVSPTGDVFDWVTLPPSFNYQNCWGDVYNWQAAANTIIDPTNTGVLSGYDYIIYLFNSGSCPNAGMTNIGNQIVFIDLSGALTSGITEVMAHELGHAFGTDHASTPTNDYGDTFEAMGIGYPNPSNPIMRVPRHMSNYRKAFFGWYAPSNTQDALPTGTQTFDLIPSDKVGGVGAKVLRIPRKYIGGAIIEYYYLEYRQPLGAGTFENFSPANQEYTGVLLRTAPSYYLGPAHSYLMNNGFAVTPTQTYSDTANGVTITTNSLSASSVNVSVSYSCVKKNPALGTSYPLPVRSGTNATVSLSPVNNDTPTCPAGQFTISATPPSGWTLLTPPPTISLPPNSVGASFDLSFSIPPATPDGSYMATFNLTSIPSGYSVMAYRTIRVDNTPPAVTIAQPSDGTVLPTTGTLTISSSGTDDNDLTLSLAIDGLTVKQCPLQNYSNTCDYNWPMDPVTNGPHTITATSADSAGNVHSSMITVYRTGTGGSGCEDLNHNHRIDPRECMPFETQ